MIDRFLVFECAVRDCAAEFWLNGVPVIHRSDPEGRFFAGPMDENVVPGRNEIAVVVHPGPEPALALSGRGDRCLLDTTGALAWARLCRYPRGAVVGTAAGEELLRVEWHGGGRPEHGFDVRASFPRVCTAVADLGPVHGRWAWQDAPRLSPDPDLHAEIAALLAPLCESMAAGDPEPYIRLSRIRLDEGRRAYGLAEGEKEALIRLIFRQDAGKDWWRVQPLEPDLWSLRRCAGGRMVEAVRRDREPIVRLAPDPDGSVVSFPLLLARIDGRLQIVR